MTTTVEHESPQSTTRLSPLLTRAATTTQRVRQGLATFVVPVTKAIHPFFATVSSTGWLVAVVGVVLLAAGLVLGWAELVFAGAAFVSAFAIAALFTIGRSRFAVSVRLNPRRVTVGERAVGEMIVTNTAKRNSLATTFELPVGDGLAVFDVPGLTPDDVSEELFAVPTERRAVIIAGPARSVRGDRLGLFRRSVDWTDPIELFVHPRVVRLHPTAAGLVRDLEGQITKKITNNDISFHALRDYVRGDDVRYVHWRSSARTGQLMVRQFEESRRSQLTIVHSANRRYYASDDEFETAVSVTASIATQVIRDATDINVVSEGMRLRTHTLQAMLDDSCRIQPFDSDESARDFARNATKRLPDPSVVVIVAGSMMDAGDYRSIQRLFSGEVNVIALRVAEGGQPRVQDVAGLQVYTIGALRDLTRIMEKAQ
ncbi:DUF58 domain-containing protein [Paramicrobacterium agarici]|uniref:Uncharacterized protein (DUF58 family) n=1 Tax=Paramicrobacterium agarici TaxID=630514 RepID=A0A2A9E1U2_9MICO|nr:DUF58 domain-containing protein [Microbacterium agarici]PFG32160.1 uncharacterized protein (DUF58 family) [Microbacterium agarici]TQO22053.1 uncharacterized protein (DUF58 family) [Microbacterium agarici]